MNRLFLISFTFIGILNAQKNIQVSASGCSLLSNVMMVSQETGYINDYGEMEPRDQLHDIEPGKIFLSNWIVKFEWGDTKTRYVLTRCTEYSVKNNVSTIRYDAIFYGPYNDNYKPEKAQVKLIITDKDSFVLFYIFDIYFKYKLSFML